MPDHVRKQVRDGAATALTGLSTSGSHVFPSRTRVLNDAELPGLKIYTNNEDISMSSKGSGRVRERDLELVVECCSKKSAGMDDELDAMILEVEEAIDANQGIAGVKYIEPVRIEIEMQGEGEAETGVAKITFTASYFTAQGAPDVAR